MNNISLKTLTPTSDNPDILLSEQNEQVVKTITLPELKALCKETNQVHGLYDKAREKRNRAIQLYIKENDTSDVVYALAYELKLTPKTIYTIKAQGEKNKK